MQRFMDSCFGHFLCMHRTMQFSGTVVHRLLLLEIHHDGSPYEIRFLLGNVSVCFSKIEFCLIIGLKFGIVPDTSKYLEVENDIHQRCFGGQNEITIEELKERVQQGQWTKQFDVVKLCLLLLLYVFLIGEDERGSVPIWKIFALEFIPALAKEFATRRNVDPFPRILKWEFMRRPRLDKVKKIIKDRMFAEQKITPTNHEVGKFYYEGVQNVEDLYPAPDALNNMLDENDVHEGGCSTNNHTPEQTRPTSTVEPSGTAGGPPRVRAHQFESVMHSFQELREEFMDFESRIQDRLEIFLDELPDSDRC
ncbi:hypothetical protein Ddye_011067 [Dipteronia dyeriana]|uniref:DUF1985 domain-containing protein n=1 Tax=Dipteronia dyeriana TaxID=168575 RepID=A0AAE0CNS4_9ROSI|nr:hypothetical protein Ddye_011067 [Dipteronia dyeriana]